MSSNLSTPRSAALSAADFDSLEDYIAAYYACDDASPQPFLPDDLMAEETLVFESNLPF